MTQAVTQVIGIVGTGAIAALVAIGLAVSFRLMGVINFAHGAFIMMGAYAAVLTQADWGLPWPAAIAIAAAIGALAGGATDWMLIRRLRGAPALSILCTFGLAEVLQQLAQLILGDGYRPTANPFPGPVRILGAYYPAYNLVITAVAVVVLLAVVLALRLTPLGVRARAVAADRALAETLGIRVSRLNLAVFAVSTGLAALAGGLVAPISTVSPTMGESYLFTAFIVVIVGGNEIGGVLAAAIAVAAVQNLVAYWANSVIAYLAVLALAFVALRRPWRRSWVREVV